MKRKVEFRLLLVLLILSIIFFYLPYVVDSGVSDPPRNPLSIHDPSENAESNVTFTWTSRWQAEPQDVVNGSSIAGDHIVIHSSWDFPVTSSNISIRSGFNETRNGTLPEPGPGDEWPAHLCFPQNYTWETYDGIHFGDEVRVFLDVSPGGDPAFYIFYWADTDFDKEVDLDELGDLAFSMDEGGFEAPEIGYFESRLTQSIAIRVYCWNYAYSENMTYTLEVDTRDEVVIESEEENPSEILFDTYYLYRNTTANLTLSATNDSEVMSIEYSGVTLGNYFAPIVNMHPPLRIEEDIPFTIPVSFPATPILQGRWNLTWTCYDINANDTNYFSVWLSSDGGTTFALLEQNLTETFYVWDSTGYTAWDHIYRVKAYSLDFTMSVNSTLLCSTENPPGSYWPGDYADSVTDDWESTYIIPQETPVSTTTSNTVQPPDDTVLLIAAGVGVVIILILGVLLKQKK